MEKRREYDFFERREAARNLVRLTWDVIEFDNLFGRDDYDGRRDGLHDKWANERLVEIAKMVRKDFDNGFAPDTIIAEYWMDNVMRPLKPQEAMLVDRRIGIRPKTPQEAILTDRRAGRAIMRLSSLVESGHIDPTVAERFLDSGLDPRVLEEITNKLVEQGSIDVEAYKDPVHHFGYNSLM